MCVGGGSLRGTVFWDALPLVRICILRVAPAGGCQDSARVSVRGLRGDSARRLQRCLESLPAFLALSSQSPSAPVWCQASAAPTAAFQAGPYRPR